MCERRCGACLECCQHEADILRARCAQMAELLRDVKKARDEGWYEDDIRWASIDSRLAALTCQHDTDYSTWYPCDEETGRVNGPLRFMCNACGATRLAADFGESEPPKELP